MSLAQRKPLTAPRRKKCRAESCRQWFKPHNSLQTACSRACALELAKVERAKEQRQMDKETLKALKTRGEVQKEAQAAFNAWVRERDHNKPCISCDRQPSDNTLLTGSRWDAGHYRSIGANPELRFEPLNCHRQCVKCNQHLSGNAVNYRIGLRERIGDEKLEWLEGHHEAKNYSKSDLIEIRDFYRREARKLKKKNEGNV